MRDATREQRGHMSSDGAGQGVSRRDFLKVVSATAVAASVGGLGFTTPAFAGQGGGFWGSAGSMSQARGFYSLTLLGDGRVLLAGGFVQAPRRALSGCEIYDPDTWTQAGNLFTARAGHAAVRLNDGRVLVAGGQTYTPDERAITLSSVEIYDPATGLWTPTRSMAVARTEPVLTLLNDGKVLISGATRAPGPLGSSAEIYDPATERWRRIADMNESRNDHIQVLLADGTVLVAGGFRGALPGEVYFDSAEIYDPILDTWTPTGTMNMPRADGEPVVLRDGKVLITGGNIVIEPPARTDTAEIYDPETGDWTLTSGAMSDPKVDHAYTLLNDGTVLVAGGLRSNDNPVTSADLYDPIRNRWTSTASMSKARSGILAVKLDDGSVLVPGGLNFDPDAPPEQALSSVELYTP